MLLPFQELQGMPDFKQLFPTLNRVEASGIMRTCPEDFRVTEINSIELSGTGEHLWLYIQKTSSNTNWVAKCLANVCQVPRKQIGFAGLKDRHAVTKQWFSVQLPKIAEIQKIESALPDEITILKSGKHNRKIKTGQLEYNHFEIIIRNIQGSIRQIEQNIHNISKTGVPNYFGPQRFGHDMGNIQKASDWFAGTYKVKTKNLKSLLISTARSHIFNTIVAQRIQDKIWNVPITGDILQLDKSHSWFRASDATPAEIQQRLKQFDIHISAAMYGENVVQSTQVCASMETKIAAKFPIYQQGFEKFRLQQDRRAIRINPIELKYTWLENNLQLNFKLLPGAYATAI
ncbi:tRNA pseudouridine(13) synthase, partial [hydrothermal vent metagenome]